MKRVIKDTNEVLVLLEDVGVNKIYVVKSRGRFYKLHRIESNWMFCDMENSNCGRFGVSKSIEEAISVAMEGGEVYEFDTLVEFLDWVRSNY